MSNRPPVSSAENELFLSIANKFDDWLSSPPPHRRTSEAEDMWTTYHRLKALYEQTKVSILRDACWIEDSLTKTWAIIDWRITLLNAVDPTLAQAAVT